MVFQGFLSEVGRRLRSARERAGLSVAEVARRSDVSRRYLTDAEAGRANPSVLVLARLSVVLDLPLGRLLDIPLRSGAKEGRVALVGLRGAGKSSAGRRLARELEAPFVELDARIEDRAGLGLAEIFDLHGEAGFHRYEAEALESVLAEGQRLVLATGGSIVSCPKNFARLRETCRTVWLRAGAEDHYARVMDQGDARPMRNRPRAMEELREILAQREPLYSRCERVVDTAGKDLGSVVGELLEWSRAENA